MDNQIPEEIKHERFNRVLDRVNAIVKEINKSYIGKTVEVLVEGKSKTNDNMYTGRSSQNKVVIFEADDSLVGKVVDVRIDSQHLWYLKGTIVK